MILRKVLMVLLIVGGLNWGSFGLFGFDFVGWLFGGSLSWAARAVFILVGLAALCTIPYLFANDDEDNKRERGAP